jgi:acyl-CoA synthetase (AMP-forming)/AMP-acid ligase II
MGGIEVLGDILAHHAGERPDKPALVFEGRTTTYAGLLAHSNQVGRALAAVGCGKGTRVAQIGRNSDVFHEMLFGAALVGSVLVAVNWRLAPPEIAYIINDAKAEVIFVGREYCETIEKLLPELPTIRHVVAIDGGHPAWPAFEAWRDAQADGPLSKAVAPADVALQMYTSGTTGHPKGAMLTHANFVTALSAGVEHIAGWSVDDMNLVVMPQFHIAGAGWGVFGLFVGASNVVMRDVDPGAILALIQQHKITRVFMVPAVILFCLQHPNCAKTDFSSLQVIAYGASPIPLPLLQQAVKVFRCDFVQVYGLTETTGAVTQLPAEDHSADGNPRMASCGKPYGDVELKIVDTDGNALKPREIGEICCRTRQNMAGYWNQPEASARAIRGEWFHTGDAGYLDEDGYLYIYDRVKDMVVSGGENIYPAEVESALFGFEGVADVAVIGVPDEKWGEAVKAIVVKKPGATFTADDLIAYARTRIAGYKVPKSVDFAEALPRNPSGKILKRELRAPYWEGRERQVH